MILNIKCNQYTNLMHVEQKTQLEVKTQQQEAGLENSKCGNNLASQLHKGKLTRCMLKIAIRTRRLLYQVRGGSRRKR